MPGVYIAYPFCAQKCTYCNFASGVFPRELEDALMTHPDIADVVVTGVPDETYGHRLAAYVVVRDGVSLSHEDIVAFAKERVARFAVPKATRFLDELPRNPTGKVMKRELPPIS